MVSRCEAAPDKRITFLYLANDVMQTSRAKGFEFLQEFSKILAPIVSKVFTYACLWRKMLLFTNV